MAINHPPHISLSEQREHVDQGDDERGDDKTVVWTFLWTLFGFKIATILSIVWITHSWEFVAYVAVSVWPFLIIPIAATAGPTIFYWRKRRVRRRRTALQRSEWMLD